MGSISNSVVALATGAASIEALNSVATLAKNTVAAARDATAKAQKDVDDSSKAADAAQEKLVKAQQTINNAAAAQRNAKTDDEKKKADADMDKAQASLSPAQANYVQSRAQLKNAVQTLKNAQAQLASLVNTSLPSALSQSKAAEAAAKGSPSAAKASDDSKTVSKATSQAQQSLDETNKKVAEGEKALQSTAPGQVALKSNTGTAPPDGKQTTGDSTGLWEEGGEGESHNEALLNPAEVGNGKDDYVTFAAKAEKAAKAPVSLSTGEEAPSSGTPEGATKFQAPKNALATGVGQDQLLTLSSSTDEVGDLANEHSNASAEFSATQGGVTARPAATATAASAPREGSSDAHAADATGGSSSSGSAEAAALPKSPAGASPATPARRPTAGASTNDGTGPAKVLRLDAQPNAAAASSVGGDKSVSVGGFQYVPSKTKAGEGKLTGSGFSVDITQSQFERMQPALQSPTLRSAAKDLVSLGQNDPDKFNEAIEAANRGDSDAFLSIMADQKKSDNAKARAASGTVTGSSDTEDSAEAADASKTVLAGPQPGAQAPKSTREKDLRKEFFAEYNQTLLDKMGDDNGPTDKNSATAKKQSKASKGGDRATATGAAMSSTQGAVVGGGGGTINQQVMGLSAQTGGGNAAATVAGNSQLSRTGESFATGAANTGAGSDVKGSSYVDNSAANNWGGLSGMELVQAVMLMASQEAQDAAESLANTVKNNTARKAEIRGQVTEKQAEMQNMVDAHTVTFENGLMMGSAGDLNKEISNLSGQMDSIGDDNQLLFIRLQNYSQQLTTTMQATSNISKSLFDTAKAIVGQIGH